MHAKRPFALLLGAAGASVSAGASLRYLGDDPSAAPTTATESASSGSKSAVAAAEQSSQPSHKPILTGASALSKKELGLDQSLARDVACWISAASVYAARQAFYASAAAPLPLPSDSAVNATKRTRAVRDAVRPRPSNSSTSNVYHSLFGWLQDLTPAAAHWDAQRVLQSSSFTMLLNVISSAPTAAASSSAAPLAERELFRAVGALATDPLCAREIAERATRYGKRALLNLAARHDDDPRVGAALQRLVVLDDAAGCRFGPAHLVSLLSLAVAPDVPDAYVEFALWGLRHAASPLTRARRYEWRKTLFGDDASATIKRKLLANDALWSTLLAIGDTRCERVQLQAAQLWRALSDDPTVAVAMQRRDPALASGLLCQWLASPSVPLACAALAIVANVAAADPLMRATLLDCGALDVLRTRILANSDCRLTAPLLQAVHALATPLDSATAASALDAHALSFVHDADDDDADLLHQNDFVVPGAVAKRQYVDGWIELFTALLRADDPVVRSHAAECLHLLASTGAHSEQSKQEWLIAILDAVLETVPPGLAQASTSVRQAKSRTRPLLGHAPVERATYEAAHAKALRALAFVLGRSECQAALVQRGGIPLLKLLLASDDVLVQRETARVLANLFTCSDLHASVLDFVLHDVQLPFVLERWTQASDLQLQSLAHRARSNRRYQATAALRRSDCSDSVESEDEDIVSWADELRVKYLDGVHPLHLSSTPDPVGAPVAPTVALDIRASSADDDAHTYDVDVVFLHGLLGCPYETWMCGDDADTVWAHSWLLDDLKRAGRTPRVLSIGYDSQLLASDSAWGTLGFESTSDAIARQLTAAGVGGARGDRPVVFVTHSLGGVLLKQVLHDSATKTPVATNQEPEQDAVPRLVDSVRGVLFYGVPHHGSPVAQTIQAFRPQSLGIAQHPVTEHLHGTPHSAMLNDSCASLFAARGIAALSIGETLPCRLPVVGFETLVVPPESANPGFGDFVTVPDATHMSVCKPSSPDDVRYRLAKDFIVQHAAPRPSRSDQERVRIRTPQKFALGTRVANPLEGRTGQIDRFDADTGLYSLLFHDGHREDVDEAGAAQFVIKTQETDGTSASARAGERSDDPDNLLGAAVSKTVRSYDNQRATVAGYVLSYLASKNEYRVSFSDDTFQNWSRSRTRASVRATADAASDANSGTKRAPSDIGSHAHKTHKKHKASHDRDHTIDDSDDEGNTIGDSELNQMKYPSRSTAYAVIRKVLCVILAQSTIKKTRTEKQVTVLNNEDLKPKRALENFVEAGGLVCLQKVLVIWMRKPATHAGALLILKVLAALPGVTAEAVLASSIGKTLRGISTVCQSMGHVDPVLGDLSEWIIRSWKRNVMRKALTVSAKELIKENSTALRAVDTLPLYVPPPPTAEKHMSEQQVMTNHLRRLLSGQVDAPRAHDAAKHDDDDDANVVYLPRFNSLGSEDARRPVRQAILLDTLAAKINREHVEGLRKQQQAQERAQSASTSGRSSAASTNGASGSAKKSIWDEDGTDSVSIGRLVFGRPQIQLFHKDGLVAHLRSTARSRIFARQSAGATDDGLALDDEVPAAELPRANRTLAPTKSILKADTTEIVPIAQVRW